jgi:hypothetical protein
MLLHRGLAILAATVGLVAITACVSKHEMSDDEWCKSFEYRPGTQDYTECRSESIGSDNDRDTDPLWM